MASLQPSVIREILKATADPEVISFAAGNPAPNAFPVKEVESITAEIFSARPIDALQYSLTEGYPPLREAVLNLLEGHYGIPRRDNGLLILSGAQQGADLVSKILIEEGDTVLCEDPSFIGCLNCFRSYGANLVGIPMEADGMDLSALENALKTEKNVRMLYIIPNFQNPTGITTSAVKRREILRLCQQYGVMILEDNPYGDLRFAGEPVPSIKSMDNEGIVVYVGSFSKILAPGLRIGYTLAPNPLIAKMTVGKQCTDVHTTILAQMICERWLAQTDFEKHLERLVKIYRSKSRLMLAGIEKEFPSTVAHTVPEGGLFLWCTLPPEADMQAFCQQAIQHKVAVVPGNAFLADQQTPCRSFRMNFSTPSDEDIIEGVRRLGELARNSF